MSDNINITIRECKTAYAVPKEIGVHIAKLESQIQTKDAEIERLKESTIFWEDKDIKAREYWKRSTDILQTKDILIEKLIECVEYYSYNYPNNLTGETLLNSEALVNYRLTSKSPEPEQEE